MDRVVQQQAAATSKPDYREAWDMVSGQLRKEVGRADFETWVQPLKAIGYSDQVFRLSTINTYNQEWIKSRLASRITSLLSGMLNEPVELHFEVQNKFHEKTISSPQVIKTPAPVISEEIPTDLEPVETGEGEEAPESVEDDLPEIGEGKASPRKIMLHRAYGSRRARVIQPERGLFVTLYLLQEWVPLIGYSALGVILAARSMCYWNPKTGELRNSVETVIDDLAKRADMSPRNVKKVLNLPLVKRYFIRYTVRRHMTPNGIRTAGITLFVRMDDPLTPADQAELGGEEDHAWYPADYDDESDDE